MSKFSSGGASRREALRATLRVLVASLTSPPGWVLGSARQPPGPSGEAWGSATDGPQGGVV